MKRPGAQPDAVQRQGRGLSRRSASDDEIRASRYQRFEVERIQRSELRNATYNPRRIDPYARKKLEHVLKKHGLVQTLVWNRRTGNLVGGHQRLAILDSLEGKPDYYLDVAVVDVDDRQERELNVALNSPGITGEFEPEMLAELVRETPEFEIEDAGLDVLELQMLTNDPAFAPHFDPAEQTPEMQAHVKAAEEIAKLKRQRREYKEKDRDKLWNESEFYSVVLFKSAIHQQRFMHHCGLCPGDRYLSGAILASMLDLDLDEMPEAERAQRAAESAAGEPAEPSREGSPADEAPPIAEHPAVA